MCIRDRPTPFGLHDLSVAVNVLKILDIPSVVVINRSEGSDDIIEDYCFGNNIPILMKIPLDFSLLKAQNNGELISRNDPAWFERFKELGEKIFDYAGGVL